MIKDFLRYLLSGRGENGYDSDEFFNDPQEYQGLDEEGYLRDIVGLSDQEIEMVLQRGIQPKYYTVVDGVVVRKGFEDLV